jgi:ubiquitin carboxyl-terminal hydrolase 7
VPRNGTIADVLAGLQKKVNLDDDTIRDVRVYEAHTGKIYKELNESFNIAGVNEFVSLYAEKIPGDELKMAEGERTISAFNFDREPNKPHGVPFKFVVKPVSLHLLNLPRKLSANISIGRDL